MAQVRTPQRISKTVTAPNNHIANIKFGMAADYESQTKADFAFRFINETDFTDVINPTAGEIGTIAVDVGDSTKLAVTITLTDTSIDLTDYLLEILAKKSTSSDVNATNSNWGQETHWLAEPSLTVTIGGNEITLTKDSSRGNGVFKISQPIVLAFTDLQEFVDGLNQGLTLPTHYPDGTAITSSLNINEFIINTDRRLFSLVFVVNVDWAPFGAGDTFKVNKVGLVVKRTDGTI